MTDEIEALRRVANAAAGYLAIERGLDAMYPDLDVYPDLDAQRRVLLDALDHHDQNFKKKRGV